MSKPTFRLQKFAGEYPTNSETTIDYQKKQVTFNYPADKINYFDIYGGHLLYLIGWGITASIYTYFMNRWASEVYQFSPHEKLAALVVIAFIVFYPMRYTFKFASYLSHKYIPGLARDFPDTNSLVHNVLGKWKSIDFANTKKYAEEYIIEKNKLFFLKYNISLFEFEYKGKNKLIRFTTHSIEKQGHKGEHYSFIAIFEFEEEIKDGILKYK